MDTHERGYRRVERDLQDQGMIEMGFAKEMLLQAQERQDAETRAEELGCAAEYRAACQVEDFIAELEIRRADIDRDIAACKRAAALLRAVFEEADREHELP
jgi:hypothetical protein